MLPVGRERERVKGTEETRQAQRPVLKGGQRPLRVVCFLFIFYTVIFFYFFVVFFFLLCVYIPFQFFFIFFFFFWCYPGDRWSNCCACHALRPPWAQRTLKSRRGSPNTAQHSTVPVTVPVTVPIPIPIPVPELGPRCPLSAPFPPVCRVKNAKNTGIFSHFVGASHSKWRRSGVEEREVFSPL